MGFVVDNWNWTEGRKWKKMGIIQNPGPCVSEKQPVSRDTAVEM